MKKLLLPIALSIIAAPLTGCNQNNDKTPVIKERALRGVLRGAHHGLHASGHRGLKKVCATELQQYCQSADRPRDRRDCLQNHLNQLSADCKTAVESRGRGRRRRDFDDNND